MSAPHTILDNLPSLCQKLSDLVEIWRSYNKNHFACFLRYCVQYIWKHHCSQHISTDNNQTVFRTEQQISCKTRPLYREEDIWQQELGMSNEVWIQSLKKVLEFDLLTFNIFTSLSQWQEGGDYFGSECVASPALTHTLWTQSVVSFCCQCKSSQAQHAFASLPGNNEWPRSRCDHPSISHPSAVTDPEKIQIYQLSLKFENKPNLTTLTGTLPSICSTAKNKWMTEAPLHYKHGTKHASLAVNQLFIPHTYLHCSYNSKVLMGHKRVAHWCHMGTAYYKASCARLG